MAAVEMLLVGMILAYVNGHRIIKVEEIPPIEIRDSASLVYGICTLPSAEITTEDRHSADEAVHKAVKEYIKDNYGQLLTLVNPWNTIPEGYVPELVVVEDGYSVDVRCAEALSRMLADCRAAGNPAVLCSAYRTRQYQQELYNNKIYRLIAEGVSEEDAPTVAAQSVAIPGTSEHQLGLAVDIIDFNYPYLDSEQEKTPTQKWLMENCEEYGFILRYPNGSSELTGIIYEPWHYRYVGRISAKEIMTRAITLEEYLN